MVSRKPLPPNAATLDVPSLHQNSEQSNQLPYPVTPTSPHDHEGKGSIGNPPEDITKTPDTSSSENEWDSDTDEEKQGRTSIPPSLQVGGERSKKNDGEDHKAVPPSLRPGESPARLDPLHAHMPQQTSSTWAENATRKPLQPTNPYFKVVNQGTGSSNIGSPASEQGPDTQSTASRPPSSTPEASSYVMKGALQSPSPLPEIAPAPPSRSPPPVTSHDTSSQAASRPLGQKNGVPEISQERHITASSDTEKVPAASEAMSNLTLNQQPKPAAEYPGPSGGEIDSSKYPTPSGESQGTDPMSSSHGQVPPMANSVPNAIASQEAGHGTYQNSPTSFIAPQTRLDTGPSRVKATGLQGDQSLGIVASDAPPAPAVPPKDEEVDRPALPPRAAEEPDFERPPKPPRPQISVTTETTGPSRPRHDSPQTLLRKQTGEVYPIRHINWVDGSSGDTLRRTPILVQNANGPCPLLALVNALTLTTPPGEATALVETLRVREQVSLGLLLDAVFDELMSGRRGGAAQELPDVSELYQFLITLHTGMNVNPKLASPPRVPNIMDAPAEGPLDRPAGPNIPSALGDFEPTREMRLYSTFSIPLIHGWLPRRDSTAYSALVRSAPTYEDAQNLLFREEELEAKLRQEGLSQEEQQLLQDVTTIKYFLNQAATQLTPNGLDDIALTSRPGSIAILFRNDHFSTLYKHPHTHQLLQLVTDAGYATHDEIVWESLVDVNGERSEFLSGDFRPVGNSHAGAGPPPPSHTQGQYGDDTAWTAVESGRGGRGRRSQQSEVQTSNERVGRLDTNLASSVQAHHDDTTTSVGSPKAEQEDHDLALALQLQEEEEDRHRREVAARRREDNLSQEYISQQHSPQQQQPSQRRPHQRQRSRGSGSGSGSGPGGLVPNARNRQSSQTQPSGGQNIRPLIPPRRNQQQPPPPTNNNPEAGIDAPPPTYEQAAGADPYYPPPDHPAHPSSSPSPATSRPPGGSRTSSGATAYTQSSGGFTQPTPQHLGLGPGGGGRRVSHMGPSHGGGAAGSGPVPLAARRRPGPGYNPGSPVAAGGHGPVEDRNKDCIVM